MRLIEGNVYAVVDFDARTNIKYVDYRSMSICQNYEFDSSHLQDGVKDRFI